MRLSIRARFGVSNLLAAGGLICLVGGCGDDKPAVAPAAETTVKANESASAAWQAEKAKMKPTKGARK